MIKGIAEIFNEVKKAKSVNQKIKILHDHEQTHGKEIEGMFELTYDNRLQWDLPEGNPPYKPLDKSMDCQGNLIQDMRRMPLFLKGLNNLNAMKREQLFVRMLEEIDPDAVSYTHLRAHET